MTALLCFCAMANAEMRTWTSRKGDTVEAEYVRMRGDKVVLKTADGKTHRIPVEGLCDDDQEYLSHAAAVPPRIQIDVDEDVDIDKQVISSFREKEEQTITCNVLIRKANSEPCFDKFKVNLFLIAEVKESSEKIIIDTKEQSVSFANQDTAQISLTGKVENETGYDWAAGLEYEGHIVCVQDDSGEIIAMKATKNAYEKNMGAILKAKKGDLFTEDFVKAK